MDTFARSSISLSYATSFAGSGAEMYVLAADGNLWLEHQPFGKVPPQRELVDNNVAAFQPLEMPPDNIYVLGRDGNLWLEHAPINGKFGKVPPPREHVDGNVAAFQAVDADTIYVLGGDGNLWLESSINGKFGKIPPRRVQIDGNVAAFQPLDDNIIYVLGTDGNLWFEHTPFGKVPPPRERVDGNVAAFQALDVNTIYVLGRDGNLWLEHSINGQFGKAPPPREHVDGNVAAFQALDTDTIYVLSTGGNLWLEHSINGKFGKVPPPREHVDAKVEDFQAHDWMNIYVLGTDGNLWWEQEPFGKVPPQRNQVDGNLSAPLAYGNVRPSYQILTVVYAPPGTNGGKSTSAVDYGRGSSTGTTTSTSSSFKDGMDINASVGGDIGVVNVGGSVDFNFSKTNTDSSSIESKKSEGFDIKFSGPAADGINHDHDLFYLWLNPILSVAIDRKNNLNWELSNDGPTMDIQYVSVGWLKNPSSMPPGVKQQLDAAGLTQSDYTAILSTNPFASGATAIDSNRYWPLTQSFPYEPPANASDPVPTTTYTIQNSVTQSSTQTQQLQYGVSISLSQGIKTPFTESLKVTGSFQWTNTNSQSIQNQSSQSASVTIGGPAFGYHGPTELLVYWDSVYSSFMFAFP